MLRCCVGVVVIMSKRQQQSGAQGRKKKKEDAKQEKDRGMILNSDELINCVLFELQLSKQQKIATTAASKLTAIA